MLTDGAVSASQAQAGASADIMSGKKGLEEPRLHFRCHPATGIAYLQANERTRLGLWMLLGIGRIETHPSRRNGQCATAGHGGPGIGYKAKQNGFDHSRVREHQRYSGPQPSLERDAIIEETTDRGC